MHNTFFDLLLTGVKIEIKPYGKGTDNFDSCEFWMDGDGIVWSKSPNMGRFPRYDMNPETFNSHIVQMINEHFQISLYA